MELLFFCTRWGQEDTPWESFCEKVKDAGFDGVETSLPLDENEIKFIQSTLSRHGLKLIGQHWDTVTPDFETHVNEFDLRLRSMAAALPLFITSHTGKDFFTFQQNEYLIERAQKISAETGVKIVHETHRGKFSFAAHVTQAYLQKYRDLRLTLDISHWYAVAESYLADQQTAVDLAVAHTDHIHARIGHAHGPQVTDPRSAEWEEVVATHIACWDRVINAHRIKGSEYLTVTAEFGPHPYMQLQPFSTTPVANQWDVNLYMKDLLKNRYK
ncbi:TIM barrel protein [Mucilaginibacter sp. PAMB04168]|uniref:sugar phosphate isomerase/epimerase family protein n=1 Tax=Mucilaginibacter sp. PAMB04168 TaxID=3138567 RepID=UPI0031F6207A